MLPFLKKKRLPLINEKPLEEKVYNESFDDKLEHYLHDELFDAVLMKDVHRFREALKALVMNMFEEIK